MSLSRGPNPGHRALEAARNSTNVSYGDGVSASIQRLLLDSHNGGGVASRPRDDRRTEREMPGWDAFFASIPGDELARLVNPAREEKPKGKSSGRSVKIIARRVN
jgi:hypothetical protein